MKYKINYKKANDAVDIKKRLESGLLQLGYTSLGDEGGNRFYANTKGEIITWHTDPNNFKYLINKAEKTKGGALIKFTNEELKLLDSLDLELVRTYEDFNVQSITDWLDAVKAHDEINIVEYIARVLTPEYECLMDTPEDIVLQFHQRSGEGDIHLMVALDDKTVEKYYCTYIAELDQETCEYVALSNKELKLFDSLDFTLSSDQKSYLKQNLSDWLDNLKATDAIDKRQYIIDFYKRIHSDHTLNRVASDKHYLYFQKGYEKYIVETRVNLLEELISRYRIYAPTGMRVDYVPFQSDELELFDKLDFDFEAEYKTYTPQKMTDWLDKRLKAKDGKNEKHQLIEKVEKFLKSKGELSNFEVLLEDNVEIYFTFKHVADKNFVISIDLETRLIKKGVAIDDAAEYHLTGFALSELKLFDMMGFELDPELYAKANISDWYAAEWYGKGAKS